MAEINDSHQWEIQQALTKIRSENPRERSTAVEQLGNLRTGLSDIQLATTDRNGYVRAAAAKALASFQLKDVALYLGDLLWDANPFVRSAAIRSLGRLKAIEYTDHIMDSLTDRNPYIRAAVLRALGDLQAPEAAEALVTALKDPHRKVRLDAARGLRQLADPQALPMMEETLEEAMQQPRLDLPFLNTLIQGMANCGAPEQTGPLLVRLLQETVGCRTVAARALRALHYEGSRSALVRALTDRNPNLRLAALQALSELGAEPSLPAIRMLLEDEDSRVQRVVCQCLAKAGDMNALPFLREMAFSPNPFLRPRAIESMAILDPEGSRSILLELLHDNNVAVRTAAAEALVPYIHEPEARQALEQAQAQEVTIRLRARLTALLTNSH